MMYQLLPKSTHKRTCKDAAGCPHIHARPIAEAAKQQLGSPVPQGKHLQDRAGVKSASTVQTLLAVIEMQGLGQRRFGACGLQCR